jgi:peptidoglycan/LPS O-acetylase OafA/YrhL
VRTLNQKHYLVGLDHLRALAATLVVVWHGGNFGPNWVRTWNPLRTLVMEGHTGVTLFLVLSGFLFSTGTAGRRIDYWAFLRNRFLRVYPLYLVLLLTAVAAYPGAFNATSFAQTLFLQANMPGAFKVEPFTNVFWTVAVECQFYLVFPVLQAAFERDGPRWIVACLGMATVLRLAAFMGGTFPEDVIYWHLGGRIDQFLIGMLCARLYARLRERELPWGLLSALAAAGVCAMTLVFNRAGGWGSPGWWKAAWPTVEGLAWGMLVITYVRFAPRVVSWLSVPLQAVGTWSYSLYLMHFTVLHAVSRLIPSPTDPSPTMALALHHFLYSVPSAIALAALSYYTIERPFMGLRVRYLRDRDPHELGGQSG